MLFLKSFFRQKNIKIYIIIFSIVITFLFFSISIKNYYIALVNENYSDSYLEFNYLLNKKEEIESIDNIDKVLECLTVSMDNNTYYFIANNELELDNFEIAVEKNIIDNITVGDEILIPIEEQNVNFNIKSIFENAYGFNTLYINYNTFIYLEDILHPSETTYRVILKNWNKIDKTIEKIENQFHTQNIQSFLNKKENIDLGSIIFLYNVISIVFLIVFLIVFVVTYFNILSDEKKKNKLYHCIGYNNSKLVLINFTKLALLTLCSLIISFLFYFFFSFCFNSFFLQFAEFKI